jgi:general secretion pathway protein K
MKRRGQRGIALISVLIGLAILALIAAAMLAETRVAVQGGRYASDKVRFQAIADAGIARAVLALIDRRPEERWRVDGVPQQVVLFGVPLTITIQDERGKIDLNAASGDTIAALFKSAGLSGGDAAALADKVLDWRETGPGKRLHGADADDYRAAGLAYSPRRGRFQSISELKLVLGMTPELYERVRPALTVYSGSGAVDVATAPKQVLLTLPGYDTQKADDFISSRSQLGAPVTGAVTQGKIDPRIALAGWPFTIEVAVLMREGEIVIRRDVVRITDDPKRPYWVMAQEDVAG